MNTVVMLFISYKYKHQDNNPMAMKRGKHEGNTKVIHRHHNRTIWHKVHWVTGFLQDVS